MMCPKCRKRLKKHHEYRVRGLRYGRLPGIVRVYNCPYCGEQVRTQELFLEDVNAWNEQWERKRQAWIRERAKLNEKIRWLTMPANLPESKLSKLRHELIKIIERTFLF